MLPHYHIFSPGRSDIIKCELFPFASHPFDVESIIEPMEQLNQ